MDVVVIDEVGVGSGVVDRVREVGLNKARIEAFNGGKKAMRDDRFANRNAEVWWAMREYYLEGLLDTENDDKLISQVTEREHGLDSRGRIKLESKKTMTDSPDEADALAMTFAPLQTRQVMKIWV